MPLCRRCQQNEAVRFASQYCRECYEVINGEVASDGTTAGCLNAVVRSAQGEREVAENAVHLARVRIAWSGGGKGRLKSQRCSESRLPASLAAVPWRELRQRRVEYFADRAAQGLPLFENVPPEFYTAIEPESYAAHVVPTWRPGEETKRRLELESLAHPHGREATCSTELLQEALAPTAVDAGKSTSSGDAAHEARLPVCISCEKFSQHLRGLCPRCYHQLRKYIKSGGTTWKEAEGAGLCLEKRTRAWRSPRSGGGFDFGWEKAGRRAG